ncbi:TrkH family potassium uptake protein [Falsihalocynthiibacter arcticus]|uniref:Potassium transporter TrkH n=1 Tax=Falsihalocynthiibacter arcticus TaxID=1579316 RepID=A0A126V337_9RHOB|nr:potassium transporter TrkG [Falsihalocynthiibacter arcticus]AML52703.1 potassium transporter TrkH [Falsihalocynthiibacter arcticus]
MLARILGLPLFVILMGIGSVAMFLPALHAGATRDFQTARVFFYGGLLFLIFTLIIALATANYKPRNETGSHLLSLFVCFVLLPMMLAVPFHQTVTTSTFGEAYFEMVSSITTTGATQYADPAQLPRSVHLWRALVAWLGGFFVWVSAVAILAPLNLGGFEVLAEGRHGTGSSLSQISRVAGGSVRLQRAALRLLPIYSGLTAVFWVFLIIAGDRPFGALIHSMSTFATSGISATGGMQNNSSAGFGEFVVLIGMCFALSRLTFSSDMKARSINVLKTDPEIRIATFLIMAVPSLIFMRHWFGALEEQSVEDARQALSALWGSIFTTVSFLSTTGFESASWTQASRWSGLATPGLIPLGLAMVGGGVATTAGGVKLLRIYALYKNGQREIERIIHPTSVAGSGPAVRHLRRRGAYVAWIFFMLFALSVSFVMLLLAYNGVGFDNALILTIAALTTTGPLANVVTETPISYATLSPTVKLVLGAAMVVGRLETLAVIALLNPDTWRR